MGNTPSGEALVWSIASILSLFAVLGLVVYVVHRYGFFNGGLFLMFSTGLLPIGLLQVWCSYTRGFWYARSAEFYELPIVQTLGSWRAVPDAIIILLGAFPLLYFLLTTFPRLRQADFGSETTERSSEAG